MSQAVRRFGDYEVSILADGFFEPGSEVLIHAGGEAAMRALTERLAGQKLHLDVNSFMARGPGGVALIDAAMGPAWGAPFGAARAAMAAAGVAPADVETVLMTHLHLDHALGLLDGDAPWLPRAQILVPAADLAFFSDAAAGAGLPEERREAFDLTSRILTAYAGRVRGIGPGAVAEMKGVELMALPGHTPGHSGYVVRGAETLLIWADTVHVRELQVAEPDIGLVFDLDPAQARASRLEVLEMVAREGWVVAGSHVTGFGRVVREGAGFGFVAP